MYTNKEESINRQPYKEIYNVQAVIDNLTEDLERLENGTFKFQCKDETRSAHMLNYLNAERKMFDAMDIFNHHEISKFWSNIKNPDGSSNANYGYMTFGIPDTRKEWDLASEKMNQFEYCFNILKERPNSKQGIIHFHRPKDQWIGNLDVPCNLSLHFYVKKNKYLCLAAYLRSNDLIYGTPYNVLYFLTIYSKMFKRLKAEIPDLEIGDYTHSVTSMRIYLYHEKIYNQIVF